MTNQPSLFTRGTTMNLKERRDTMGKFSPKHQKACSVCGRLFLPTNPRNHLCSDACREEWDKQHGRNRHYADGIYVKKGYNQSQENNNNWKGGTDYRRLVTIESCELCGSTDNLVVHHKNHDRRDNRVENLQVLCKKCHQKHHCIRDSKGRFASHR